MAEWVDVNGAKIEKQYLEESIAEAKSYQWKVDNWRDDQNHTHCLICNGTIPEKPLLGRQIYYQTILPNKILWMCSYCYDRFIK